MPAAVAAVSRNRVLALYKDILKLGDLLKALLYFGERKTMYFPS